MNSKRLVQLTISIEPELKASLETLARAHGFLWGADKPNVSALIRAIGDGRLTIVTAKQLTARKKENVYE